MPIQINELSIHFRLFKWVAGLSGTFSPFSNDKYENFYVSNQISVKIDNKEILRILGENDAEKITLIKLLVGLLHPSSCDVNLMDIPHPYNFDYIYPNQNSFMWLLYPLFILAVYHSYSISFIFPLNLGKRNY